MRTPFLNILAPLCVALAALLFTGYFVQCVIQWRVHHAGNQAEIVSIRNGEGRSVLYLQRQIISTANPLPAILEMRWHLRLPDARRSVWDFDAHRLPLPNTASSWIFACPIWCLLLPCLIPPTLWMFTRHRPEPRGFAIGAPISATTPDPVN
jgi:hypothetical protein